MEAEGDILNRHVYNREISSDLSDFGIYRLRPEYPAVHTKHPAEVALHNRRHPAVVYQPDRFPVFSAFHPLRYFLHNAVPKIRIEFHFCVFSKLERVSLEVVVRPTVEYRGRQKRTMSSRNIRHMRSSSPGIQDKTAV